MLPVLELPLGANIGSAWRLPDRLRLATRPQVIHALRVFGVADNAAQVDFALNDHLVAQDGDNRDKASGPHTALQNLMAIELVVQNDRDLRPALPDHVGVLLGR